MTVESAPPVDVEPRPQGTKKTRGGLDTALTLTGEILITVGVLLALFVVWQLFYTDVQSGRAQDEALAELEWVEPVAAAGVDQDTGEAITVIPVIGDEFKHFTPDGAPVMAEPAKGTTFATLYVPRWGSEYIKPISQGVTRKDVLDKLGIGHYPNTAMPGEVGNFAIAGHRTTYGKPFADVDQLVIGDYLVVQTEEAWYVYQVSSTDIVLPTHVESIATNPLDPGAPATQAMITLTTCHPKFSAAQRFIVHGTFVYWAPTGHGFPAEIVEEA